MGHVPSWSTLPEGALCDPGGGHQLALSERRGPRPVAGVIGDLQRRGGASRASHGSHGGSGGSGSSSGGRSGRSGRSGGDDGRDDGRDEHGEGRGLLWVAGDHWQNEHVVALNRPPKVPHVLTEGGGKPLHKQVVQGVGSVGSVWEGEGGGGGAAEGVPRGQ